MSDSNAKKSFEPIIKVERLEVFKGSDLEDLCDATEKTIDDAGLGFSVGFNWVETPARERLENYWKGLLLVPERTVFVGRIDGVIASSIQLIKPPPSNKAQSFSATMREHFVAPWARGHGLAKLLLKAVEEECVALKLKVLKLEVRATQTAAISLYESLGFKKWGELDKYEFVNGAYIAGHFYYKDLL